MARELVRYKDEVLTVRVPVEVADALRVIVADSGASVSEVVRGAVVKALAMDKERLLSMGALVHDAANWELTSVQGRAALLGTVGLVLEKHLMTRGGMVPLQDLDRIVRLMLTIRGDPEKITREQSQTQSHSITKTYVQQLEDADRQAAMEVVDGQFRASDRNAVGGRSSGDGRVLPAESDEGRELADAITPGIEAEIMAEGSGRPRRRRASKPRRGAVVAEGTAADGGGVSE